ncbi:unnamed protein product [Pseudo-nitzschia multistriata]|uniref:PDZ domain-containing protein n=1 Tax=Pseudo-nitzschia multistriata TaxID=183589 RepID=A0A448ZMX5_9STRA|nr:unnamed protein product [Pseudo-nitzschia multistriata]
MSSPASSNIGDFGCWPVEAKNCYDPMGHKTSRESSSSVQSHEESSIFDGVKKNFNAGKTLDQLVDLHEQQNSKTWISYLDKEGISPSLYSVTVRKGHRNEKIGIFVHLKRFPFGNRLVVSQISPAGKFADTGIEVGDVVVSINAENMIKDPKTQRALDIVTSATDTVTIVVQKHLDSDDFQSATETSISSISKDISSIAKKKPHFQTIEKVKTMDGSEHKPIRKNSEDINKRNTARKREEMTSDGSMLISKDTELKGPVSISMKESWKLTGAIVVSIEKSDSSENPGIRMGMKETSSGRAVCISEISPSSLFARTPLRMGDIILSINNVSLHDNADVFDAYAAMGKSEKRITLVAKKGGESLNDFLLAARSQPVMKGKLNHSGHDSFDSQLSSKTAGTVGTTASGESGRGGSNDSFESFDGKSEDGVIGFKSTEEWKSNFRHDAVNNASKAVSSPSRSRNEFEFDEESYGASLFGYNASSNVRIIKSYCDEDIGFKMLEITTEWGRLLVVSNVTPRSLASCTDLKVGDAILSINGISFRKKASAARASSIIRDAHREVYIEYQKLSSFSPAVPVDLQIRHHEKGEVLKTRSFDSYDSVSKKQADVSHSEKLKGNEENSSLEKALASGQEKQVGRYAPQRRQNSPVNTSERRQNSPVNTPERRQNSSVNTPVRRKNSSVNYQKLRVTVTKDEKKQTVGISLATVNNKLIVTEISAKGLLRHSPLVHGDTILAINGDAQHSEMLLDSSQESLELPAQNETIRWSPMSRN